VVDIGKASASLTLKQVTELLGVTPRQVQYLRENRVVMPSVMKRGRGNACLYDEFDVLKTYIALVELKGFSLEVKTVLLNRLDENPRASSITVKVGNYTKFSLEVWPLAIWLRAKINETVDLKSEEY